MSKFKTENDGGGQVLKFIAGMPGGLQIEPGGLQKDAGEAELGLSGQVEHSSGNGDVQELARLIATVHQRIAAIQSGVSTPSEEERRATRDEIVRGMTSQLESAGSKPTPALVAIASLLAGLTDELEAPNTKAVAGGGLEKSFGKVGAICPYCRKSNAVEKSGSGAMQDIRCSHCSKNWSEDLSGASRLEKSAGSTDLATLRVQVRTQFDELLKQINALQERRATATRPTRFQPGGVEKSDVASQELEKSLANGTRVGLHSSEHDTPVRFLTAESVAPGVQRHHSSSDGDANFHEKPGNTLSVTHTVEKAPNSAGERRSFRPGGQTDLGKADAECRNALTKGTPVGR